MDTDINSRLSIESDNFVQLKYYSRNGHRILEFCDEILMFWDGNSKASRENLEEGVRMEKPTKARPLGFI